jgi:hypothetical protein
VVEAGTGGGIEDPTVPAEKLATENYQQLQQIYVDFAAESYARLQQ